MLIIVKSSLAELVAGINEFAGPLSFIPLDITRINRVQDGSPLLGGVDGEWAFLFESHDTFLAKMYTPLLNISRKLETDVMSFRVSHPRSAIEFFYAHAGEIRRIFLMRPEGFTMPYSTGDALPGETDVPIDADMGAGLNSILYSIGFHRMDFSVGFRREADDLMLAWRGSSKLALTEVLPLDFSEHLARFGVEQPELRLGLQLRLVSNDESNENQDQ